MAFDSGGGDRSRGKSVWGFGIVSATDAHYAGIMYYEFLWDLFIVPPRGALACSMESKQIGRVIGYALQASLVCLICGELFYCETSLQ